MGFFNRLFWGASRRFANDVTNSISNTNDQKLRNKVEIYNLFSDDFYERKNFVYHCKVLMGEFMECITEEDPDEEQKRVLIKRMTNYYQEGNREIEEKGTVPAPEFVIDAYSDMLEQYYQVLTYIERFIKHWEWTISPEMVEYDQQVNELFDMRIHQETTQEEYSQALKSLKRPPESPLREFREDLVTVLQMSNKYQESLTKTGESLLNRLEV